MKKKVIAALIIVLIVVLLILLKCCGRENEPNPIDIIEKTNVEVTEWNELINLTIGDSRKTQVNVIEIKNIIKEAGYEGDFSPKEEGHYFFNKTNGQIYLASIDNPPTNNDYRLDLEYCAVSTSGGYSVDKEVIIKEEDKEVEITLLTNDLELPKKVSILGAELVKYNSKNGKVIINNINDDIKINALDTHALNTELVGVSFVNNHSNPIYVSDGKDSTLNFSANSGYILPEIDGVKVTGSCKSWKWDKNQGKLTIVGITSDIKVSIIGIRVYSISVSASNISQVEGNPTFIVSNEEVRLYFEGNLNKSFCLIDVIGADYEYLPNEEILILRNPTSDVIVDIQGWFGCFEKGTKISMADGSFKNIEDVKVNDEIIAYDADNNVYYNTVVLKVWEKETSTMAVITLKDGTTIRCTPTHGVLTLDGWKSADPTYKDILKEFPSYKLKRRDKVVTDHGIFKVKSIVIEKGNIEPIYNLTIRPIGGRNTETFIANGIITHNFTPVVPGPIGEIEEPSGYQGQVLD